MWSSLLLIKGKAHLYRILVLDLNDVVLMNYGLVLEGQSNPSLRPQDFAFMRLHPHLYWTKQCVYSTISTGKV